MRSPVFTFLIAIFATIACGLVGWCLTRGNLDAIFGAPPTRIGELLYPGFPTPASEKVRKITLFTKAASISDDANTPENANQGTRAIFKWYPKQGWMMEEPWKDRMDPYAAEALINFTRGTHVEDVIPKDKIDGVTAGFKDGVIVLRMEDENGLPLCKYLLGRKTAWIGTEQPEQKPGAAPEQPIEVPTVFIRPWDKARKNHVYACTGDIHPLFNDGFRYLRDHHPFYFVPQQLQHIRIRTSGGELTLARESEQHAWHIIKPLDLTTDPEQMILLLAGLKNLRAVKVSDRASVTLPTNGATVGTEQIAIQAFGAATETVLEILPPATPGATTRLATISDRPGTVFELPVKSDRDMLGLSGLPLTVNTLRDATLTNLNIAAVSGVLIQPAGKPAISLTRQPKQWMIGEGETMLPANDLRVFDLLNAVSRVKVAGFVTDAATDLSQWGLDNPILKLRFLSVDNQTLELAFGRDRAGTYYANRTGTTTVVKVTGDIVSKIATRAFEWRGGLIWSLSKTDIKSLTIGAKGKPLAALRYNDNFEKFEAMRDGKDVTLDLEEGRARNFLDALIGVSATRWLSEEDEGAATALADPAFVFSVTSNKVDENGEDAGLVTHELRITPASAGALNRFYYGQVDNEPNPFMLDQATYLRLTVELFSENH
ncbi:MAG: DUF4340 domain-containing protein [Luteolibacter sp.]